MNAYDEFIELLQRYSVVSDDFMWFYLKDPKDEPKIPWNLQRYYKPINISQIR